MQRPILSTPRPDEGAPRKRSLSLMSAPELARAFTEDQLDALATGLPVETETGTAIDLMAFHDANVNAIARHTLPLINHAAATEAIEQAMANARQRIAAPGGRKAPLWPSEAQAQADRNSVGLG